MVTNGLSQLVKSYAVKSKTVSEDLIELNFEIRLKSEDTSFVNALMTQQGIQNVVLVSYNGDYMG